MANAKTHWAVSLNWRNRSVFFALLFLVLGACLAHADAGAWAWTLLAVQMLVYPHLLYWHALHARDALQAEMRHMLLDGVMLGMWMAALGLPLWIAFILFIAVSLNVVIYMGVPALWKGWLAIGTGIAAVAIARGGLDLHPDTPVWISLLCMTVLTAYLVFFAHAAYERGLSLRENRRQLGERLEEITALQAKLQAQAVRDPLTGLYNRRFLDAALERELETCRRSGAPLSLVLIDIDHFKRINDTYGHPAGDEVICRLADLLATRLDDGGLVVCRYGGEEFLLMLPGTGMEAAVHLAEELRRAFEAMEVVVDGQVMQTTLSIGVSGFPEHEARGQVLVREADQALYAAKLAGRNRVVRSVSVTTATIPD